MCLQVKQGSHGSPKRWRDAEQQRLKPVFARSSTWPTVYTLRHWSYEGFGAEGRKAGRRR